MGDNQPVKQSDQQRGKRGDEGGEINEKETKIKRHTGMHPKLRVYVHDWYLVFSAPSSPLGSRLADAERW